jgi:hypothetical protein
MKFNDSVHPVAPTEEDPSTRNTRSATVAHRVGATVGGLVGECVGGVVVVGAGVGRCVGLKLLGASVVRGQTLAGDPLEMA